MLQETAVEREREYVRSRVHVWGFIECGFLEAGRLHGQEPIRDCVSVCVDCTGGGAVCVCLYVCLCAREI
jgi:hypothetical protein